MSEIKSKVAAGIAGVLVLFAVAEFVTRLGLVPTEYLPYASSVVANTGSLLVDPAFLANVGSTMLAWTLGLSLAILVSVPLGILLGSSETAYRIASPLLEFMRPVPSAALIPVAILILGQGLMMKVVLLAYATTWPILYNTVYGVHDVDPLAIQTARVFGLPRRGVLRHAVLPSAAPLIFTGIRISASLGLIVVVGAELLAAATSGIGSYILYVSANGGHMDKVLGGAAVAGLIGLAVNIVFGVIDQRVFGWRHFGNPTT
jgi:NitT/TauT family transport system permease protein